MQKGWMKVSHSNSKVLTLDIVGCCVFAATEQLYDEGVALHGTKFGKRTGQTFAMHFTSRHAQHGELDQS